MGCRPRKLLLVLALLGATHFACALGKPYFLAPDAPESSDLRTLLVLPLNFDATPKPELARGTEILADRIAGFLSESGFEVRQLRLSVVTEDWRAVQHEVGDLRARGGRLDEKRYEAARGALVRRELERQPADAAVLPTLVLREADYQGFKAYWDGVAREVIIDKSGTTRALMLMRGTDFATSLQIAIYDPSGRKVFERYAGLELIGRYETSQDRWRRVIRSDLFEDARIIDSGVRMGFEPWIEIPASGGVPE